LPAVPRRPEERVPKLAGLDGFDVAAIAPLPETLGPEAVWATYVCVESADATATKARDAGASLVTEPFDVLDAGRMAVLADPAEAAFCIWQPGSHAGAEAVNRAGTWNWSELNTPDPKAAERFYGEVFGWEASSVEIGNDEAVTWRMPGYGDFLETIEPGTRRRHAEFGVPEGVGRPWPGCRRWRQTKIARLTGASPSRWTTPARRPKGHSSWRSCESPSWPNRRERSSR
jgi:predicted enzyme related to lactoylglutathione lyase